MFLNKCVVFAVILSLASAQEGNVFVPYTKDPYGTLVPSRGCPSSATGLYLSNDILTEDKVLYRFFPIKGSSVSFKVDALNDAHVGLSSQPRPTEPMYELVIGGWGNKKSVLRRLACLRREKDAILTPQFLSDQEFHGFWVSWDGGNVMVGQEGEAKPFMSWRDPKPFRVSYIGVRTAGGSDGNWKIANASRYNDGVDEKSFDVATQKDANSQYLPVSGTAVHFKVRARNDVAIELTSQPKQTDPMYEVVIGGWGNTKSVIRKYVCHLAKERDTSETLEILNDKEYREFWFRWQNGYVMVGRAGEDQPILSWLDSDPVPVHFVGVRTTWGSTGNWKLANDSRQGSADGIEVATEDSPKWKFFPVSGNSMRIKVRASNDATIGLSPKPWAHDPMYEIVLGGWRNTKSVLRKFCCTDHHKAKAETQDILKGGEFRGFWMKWDGGKISAGREGDVKPFLSWQDPDPLPVAYVGVHTGFGSTGVWKIDGVSSKDIIGSNNNNACAPSLTRLRQGTACTGQTIFEEKFDTLREDVWQVQQYVPIDHPELPFVSYQPSTVFVKDGKLHITPVLQQTQPGFTDSSIYGSLDLYKGCTSGESSSCKVEADDGSTIIPPIVSGRINSRSSFAFTYGTISVRAKLPQGDWIYPEILLEPFLKKFVYGSKNSGILKIACARGNKVLIGGSTEYGNKVLFSGPVIDTKCHDVLLVSKNAGKLWGDDFHVYSVTWTPEHFIFSVDGEEYARVEPAAGGLRERLPTTCAGPQQQGMAPFDEHFYITLGVAAGGHSSFPGAWITKNNHAKPWKDHTSKAALNFWKDIDSWYNTWDKPALVVDYVKVVAL